MRRITLTVKPDCEHEALGLALDFIKTYPDHFHEVRPERHGVVYRMSNDNTYYVYGNAEHIRVKQSQD